MKRLFFALVLTIVTTDAYANSYRITVWLRTAAHSSTSVPNWNAQDAGQFVHEANPFWYYFDTTTDQNGRIVVILKDIHVEPGDRPNLGNAALVPLIRNHGTATPDPYNESQYMSFIFRSEADMNDHAEKIAAMVRNNNYAGVDIDYERMLVNVTDADIPKWRDDFTSLIRRIKKRLPDKIVSVCVYRRRSLDGNRDSRNAKIYDYRGLTEPGAADYMKVMMYSDIGGTSELVHDEYMIEALDFIKTQVADHKKLIVALPWYAYNFTLGKETSSVANPGGTVGRNSSEELTFTDPFNGVQIDPHALRHKILQVIRKYDVGGFAFYMSGREMNGTVWDVVRGRVGPEGGTAVADAPIDGTGCPGNGVLANETLPTGATDITRNWFQTQAKCCTSVWGLPYWVAEQSPATPALPAAFHSLRVSGVAGNRVFEIEADPIRSGCP